MLTITEAKAKVLAAITSPDPAVADRVEILHANWRVCAESLLAGHALPAFDNSAMDGFAVRAAETAAGNARLRVTGVVAAGDTKTPALVPGTAIRIMTGAPMPEGADAIAIWENCQEEVADDTTWVTVPATPLGQHIRRRGEDMQPGVPLLARGSFIDAADIMVLAAQGRAHVPVFAQPRVAIISTGNELVDLHQTPAPGQLFDANSYGMAALVASIGAQPFRLGIATDSVDDIAAQLANAHADAIVITGGISGSERDFVQAALAKAGAQLEFWKVAMRPGKPFAFAKMGDIPVFAVPGNPVSAATSFELFVRPALLKMMGAASLARPCVTATLATALGGASRAQVVRLSLTHRNGEWMAVPHPKQGSGMMSSLLQWHGYTIIDADSPGVPVGADIRVSVRAWPQTQ